MAQRTATQSLPSTVSAQATFLAFHPNGGSTGRREKERGLWLRFEDTIRINEGGEE